MTPPPPPPPPLPLPMTVTATALITTTTTMTASTAAPFRSALRTCRSRRGATGDAAHSTGAPPCACGGWQLRPVGDLAATVAPSFLTPPSWPPQPVVAQTLRPPAPAGRNARVGHRGAGRRGHSLPPPPRPPDARRGRHRTKAWPPPHYRKGHLATGATRIPQPLVFSLSPLPPRPPPSFKAAP